MKRYQKLLKLESVSQSGTTRSDFEFPTASLGVQQNDVVFCGKVITRQVEPSLAQQHQTKRESNMFIVGLRSPSGKESRCLRSGSDVSRKIYTGMFGTVKFPLQMELSNIKTRQERREPMSLPKLPVEDRAGESYWKIVRPSRRKGTLMSVLKASFRRICIV